MVMAYFWNVLREEINGTLEDFREKGAWGAFKDASLDAVDLIQDAGGALVDSTAQLLALERPTLRRPPGLPLPQHGDEVPISLSNGQPCVMGKVHGVDSISDPPRARVMRMDTGEELLVDILSVDDTPKKPLPWVMDEFGRAVGEVREKGAGVLKDGVLDTVDIVKEGAVVAFNGAQHLGRKGFAALAGNEQTPVEPLAPFCPSLEQMYGDPYGDNDVTPEKKVSAVPKLNLPAAMPEPIVISLSPRPAHQNEEVID
ncbi:unnamed protein product [Effrenium voratum]|nr:unnamed protein product [Effrenium voratum]